MRRLLLVLLLTLVGCARLDYPRLGISENVVDGGQDAIDSGQVVRVALPGIWLAGHRSSHGAVFANLVNARVGDQVCVYGKCYTVGRIVRVTVTTRITSEWAPLVLQTSLPGGYDLLVLCWPQ